MLSVYFVYVSKYKMPKVKTSKAQNVQGTKRPRQKTSKAQNVQSAKTPIVCLNRSKNPLIFTEICASLLADHWPGEKMTFP